MHSHTTIGRLGFVAAGKRMIRSGAEYSRYFDLGSLRNIETTVVADGMTTDTVSQMKKIVRETLSQTSRIAPVLKGSSREATSRNIWNFLYKHVQYTRDADSREQLREPLRLWKDRSSGVDCDCYSIFISSVLNNLGIPHAFRITKYSGDWQHVYVVVPKNGNDYSSYFTIDPVTDRFDYEVQFSQKKDFPMQITRLSGPFGACPPKATSISADGSPSKAIPGNESTSRITPLTFTTNEVLAAKGLKSTTKVLDEIGIPYSSFVDESNNLVIETQTPQGTIQLPATMDFATALSLQQPQGSPQQSTPASTPEEKKKTAIAWALGLGGAALLAWALSGSSKSKAVKLSGPPRKTAKRRLSVVHI